MSSEEKDLFLKDLEYSANGYILSNASDVIKDDEAIVLMCMRKSKGSILGFVSDRLKNDPYIVYKSIQKSRCAIYDIGENIKSNESFILSVLESKECPYKDILQYAPDHWKDDEKFMLETVVQDGKALKYVSPRLKANKEMVFLAFSNHIGAFKYADASLKNDKKFVLRFLEIDQSGYELRDVTHALRDDKIFIFTYIKQLECDYVHIEYFSKRLRKHKTIISMIVKKLLRNKTMAMGYIIGQRCILKNNDLMLKIIKKVPTAFYYVPNDFKTSRKLILLSKKDDIIENSSFKPYFTHYHSTI